MDQSILRKVKRCLAMARSSNANETATALRQAQAMMAKHGMTREDIAASDVDNQFTPSGAGRVPPKHVVMLIKLVAYAFGVEPIYGVSHDGLRWFGRVEFIGLNGAPEIACYAYEVLGRQLKNDRANYLKSLNKRLKRTTKIRRGDLYAQGWIHSVSKQVTPRVITDSETRAIEAYETRRWDKPLDSIKGRDRKPYTKDIGALAQGYADGDKVQFHQGVNGRRQAAIGEPQ